MFIISLKKSVLVTYLGIIFGVLSMSFAITNLAFADVNNITYSLIFLILAGLCDLFDGKIARMCKRTDEEKAYGIQIDSLADTVNFVVLPVVIMLSLGMTAPIEVVVFALYIICGIARLAVFNCNANLDEPVKFYTGLPVTSVAVIYPILGILYSVIPNNIYEIVSVIITFIVAVLFVSKIKVPKFKKKAFIVWPIIAIIVSVLLVVVKRCTMI